MSSIYMTEEHARFRESVRGFLEAEIAPHADAWEAARRVPRAAWRRLGAAGLLGIHYPEAYGGSGAGIFHSMVLLEELARSRMGGFAAGVSVAAYMATGAILHQGSEAQRARYLRGTSEGRLVGALAISEPDTGSDVAAIRTRAVLHDGEYVIDGRKVWITNGVEGDFHVVACRTGPEPGAAGVSLVIVDADTPGVRARRLDKVGWHTSDTAEVTFEGVRVPVSQRIGEAGMGFAYIMQTFVVERLAAAAAAIGTAALALETTLPYLHARQAFGKPLARMQVLRHRVADLATELAAARQLTYHAAWLHERGEPATAEAAMAKLLATELAKRVVDECVQMHGAAGYMEEFPMARFYRDVRALPIVAGTSEIMREIVARAVVDGVRFPGAREWQGSGTAPDGEHAPHRPVAPDIGSTHASGPPASRDSLGDSAIAHRSSADDIASSPGARPPASRDSPVTPQMPQPSDAPAIPDTIAALMRALPSRLRPEPAEGWRSRLHFHFPGDATPEWTVVVDGSSCRVAEGHEGAPDCTVTTAAATFMAIATGRQNPQTAFLLGRVKVSSVGEMMRFLKVFPPLGTG